jgi:uncharacterized membrane protein
MTFIYQLLLTLHNITRWFVLILAVIVLVQSLAGWLGKKTYTEQNRKLAGAYAGIFDLQILLGLILYFAAGWGTVFINGGEQVMSTPAVRFFAVEHWMIMLLAAIVIHIGGSRVKKSDLSQKKFRTAFIFYGISILLVLAAIPWPGMAAARPLLRIFGLTF